MNPRTSWTCWLILFTWGTIPTAWAQNPAVNDAVLAGWAQKTGQQGSLDARGIVEFRGVASVDLYRNEVDVETGDAATLSSLDRGVHQRAVLQVDWRHTIPNERLTYLQAVFSNTDDRGLQPRFRNQVSRLQVGLTGVAHRVALGDVAVSFSNLSTNQGIRGLWGDYQMQDWTFTYFAGTVAENWEALAGLTPRLGGPANLTPLRDVIGIKADHTFSETLSGFFTAQHYRDRRGELSEAALYSGHSASAGLRYAGRQTRASIEVAASEREERPIGGESMRGEALQASVQHDFGGLAVRAGHNVLARDFYTLAQAVAPGVRETYASGEWRIDPLLTYSLDWRDATTRALVAGLPAKTEIVTLAHRVGYRFADWPGLTATLSYLDNSSRDAAGQSSDSQTLQAVLAYGKDDWNGQLMLAAVESCGMACTRQQQWQLGAGRNFVGTSASLALSATAGQTINRPTAAPEQQQDQAALNATYNHGRWGQWLLGVQWQALNGGLGLTRLVTRGVSLDWINPAGKAVSTKAFVRLQQRNKNDSSRSVSENVAGMQLSYIW